MTASTQATGSVILPKVKMQIGRLLMEGMSTKQRSTFLVSGVLSATSWCVPLMLGALPQLNFVVPMMVILMAYGLLLAAAIVVSHSLLFVLPADKTGKFDESADRADDGPAVGGLSWGITGLV